MANVNANGGVSVPLKSTGVAYLLWFFLGFLGAHRFYLGRMGTGLIYLFTFGLCGFGLIYDLFVIPRMVREENIMNSAAASSNNQNHNQKTWKHEPLSLINVKLHHPGIIHKTRSRTTWHQSQNTTHPHHAHTPRTACAHCVRRIRT